MSAIGHRQKQLQSQMTAVSSAAIAMSERGSACNVASVGGISLRTFSVRESGLSPPGTRCVMRDSQPCGHQVKPGTSCIGADTSVRRWHEQAN